MTLLLLALPARSEYVYLGCTNVTLTFDIRSSGPTSSSTNGMGASGQFTYKSLAAGTQWVVIDFVNAHKIDFSDICDPYIQVWVALPFWTTWEERGANYPSESTNMMVFGKFTWTANMASGAFPFWADTNYTTMYGDVGFAQYASTEFTLGTSVDIHNGTWNLIGRFDGNALGRSQIDWNYLEQLSVGHMFPGVIGNGPPDPRPYKAVPIRNFIEPSQADVIAMVAPGEGYTIEHNVNGTTTTNSYAADDTGFVLYSVWTTNNSEFIRMGVTNPGDYYVYSSTTNTWTGSTNVWNCTNCPRPW